MKVFKKYIRDFFAIIYPDLCYLCNKETPANGKNICINCLADLPYTDSFEYNDNLITEKFAGRFALQYGAAFISYYKGSQFTDMLHRFKYEGVKKIGPLLGRMAANRWKRSDWYHQIDILVPVPLHPARRAKRGYNQSTEFAKGIRETLDIPIVENLLVKKQYTTTQTDKGRRARLANVAGSFSLNNATRYSGRHFLIIDDVITTGATIEACALELLKIPGAKVSVLSLAVARF